MAFTPAPPTTADLENRFSHHPPASPEQADLYQDTRAKFLELAKWVAEHTPPGREQALALTELQNAMMWANAATACALDADGQPANWTGPGTVV